MVYLDEERAGKMRGGEEERGWEMGMRGLEERGEEKRGFHSFKRQYLENGSRYGQSYY